jgi:hypothetical protein
LNRVISGGNLEEFGDEGGLSPDIVSADAPNLGVGALTTHEPNDIKGLL